MKTALKMWKHCNLETKTVQFPGYSFTNCFFRRQNRCFFNRNGEFYSVWPGSWLHPPACSSDYKLVWLEVEAKPSLMDSFHDSVQSSLPLRCFTIYRTSFSATCFFSQWESFFRQVSETFGKKKLLWSCRPEGTFIANWNICHPLPKAIRIP